MSIAIPISFVLASVSFVVVGLQELLKEVTVVYKWKFD